MPLAREMERLRAEHAALVILARIVTDMVGATHSPPATELAAARGQLRDTLVCHLKCEDWALYPRLRASGDPELARITREFELEMGDLAVDFVEYDDKWTAERVAAGWPDFCRETIIMLDRLAVRVEREERDLYPHADGLRAARSTVGAFVTGGATISS